jgi:hypothetical protein
MMESRQTRWMAQIAHIRKMAVYIILIVTSKEMMMKG